MKNYVRRAFGAGIVTLLAASVAWTDDAAIKPKYGPAARAIATPLALSHGYFQSLSHASPDYWALTGYYVPQMSGSACSAASVTMVLNAARAALPKTSETKLVTQAELVESVPVEHWKERLSADGYGLLKVRGVTLDALRTIAETAFRANGFPKAEVTAVHVENNLPKTLAMVRAALVENEKSADDFIIANFDQKSFTNDAEVGHIAPVAAYDAQKKRVLIMDPDREWYEPYWVSDEAFVDGMRTRDSEGLKSRGYIVVKLNASTGK